MKRSSRWLAFVTLPMLFLAACAGPGSSGNHITSADGRVYNPQNGEYEWNTPGQPPTSAGADHTSKQPYR